MTEYCFIIDYEFVSENITKKPYVSIAAKFSSEKERYFGLLLLIIEREVNVLRSVSTVIVSNDQFNNILITDEWHKIEKAVQTIRYENNFATAISNEAQELFQQMGEQPENVSKLLDSLQDAQQLKQILYERIRPLIRDDLLDIEVHVQELDSVARKPENKKAETESDDESIHHYIRSSLILDPVSGVQISQIKPGASIMLRITDLGSIAQNFIVQNNLLAPKGVKPAKAEVVSVENTPEGLSIEAAFSPNLRTKIIEAEKVMIQIPRAANNTKSIKPPTENNTKSIGFMYMAALAFLILGFIIVFIIFG